MMFLVIFLLTGALFCPPSTGSTIWYEEKLRGKSSTSAEPDGRANLPP